MLRVLIALLCLGCGSSSTDDDDDGNSQGGFAERVIDRSIVHGQGAQVVDIDADGDNDVVVALSLTDAVHLYLNEDQGGSWTKVQVAPADSIVGMDVEVADFDGDGDLDIASIGLFNRAGGSGKVTWYENTGGAESWTEREVQTFDGALYIETADLDGDGDADLLVGANEYAGLGRGVWWFANDGGTFAAGSAIDPDLFEVRSVQAADVDGDGTLDVLAAGRVSGEIAWYRNAGGTFTKSRIASVEGPTDIQLANMDGDAALELVAAMAGKLAYFDPPNWTPTEVASFPASDTTRIVAEDFDGNGSTDVAAGTNSGGGELRLFLREGETFTSQVIRSGYAGLNYVVAGDVDGDGREDLLTTTYAHTESSDVISWWANGR